MANEGPLSPLEQQQKDSMATDFREAAADIVNSEDQRWTDAQVLVIGLAVQAMKTWLMKQKGMSRG